ncbi:MAG: hypothetical protein NTX71_08195 [Candidatus Aureabacteria bacterium]|nr:hypothetical protein [Candidatus Auribacterota bacterium]
MLRGMIILLALLGFVVCVGLAAAQEQKEEGVLGRVKSVLPRSGEKACGPKEGAGMMEKVKAALPGAEDKGAAPKEGAGIMEGEKDVVPAESGK